MQFSPQQTAFITWAQNGSGSCVLEAVAGSGKTSTILKAVENMRGQSAIVAYGKKIAEEIKGKLQARGIDWKKAQAGTVHSFGFSAYRKTFPGAQLREFKVRDIIDAAIDARRVDDDVAQYASIIATVISHAKNRAIGILAKLDDRSAYADILEHFGVLDDEDLDKADMIISYAIEFLGISNRQTDFVDYDDMVYLPLIHKCKIWRFDNVFVDEAQDTNPARRAFVRALVRKGGRVIAVGDRHQAIFGFTGADVDSLDLIAQDHNCQRMPLTVSFRCPQAVVNFAQQWVPHIEAHASAPEGKISQSTFAEFVARNDLDGNASVLCRNTKPLVAAAFALIRRKVACRIEGREIGKMLAKLATRWSKIKTIGALNNQLSIFLEKETTKLLAKKQENKLQEIEDMIETLRVVMDRCREDGSDQVSDVVAYINELFADNIKGMLTLSTIHKSKGREWQRVFWLDRQGTCPSKYARQEWQQGQEINLMYVAATRAIDELVDLQGQPKAPQ